MHADVGRDVTLPESQDRKALLVCQGKLTHMILWLRHQGPAVPLTPIPTLKPAFLFLIGETVLELEWILPLQR